MANSANESTRVNVVLPPFFAKVNLILDEMLKLGALHVVEGW
jgi:hypothetical protein